MTDSTSFPRSYALPFERDYDRLDSQISQAKCDELRENGYAVIDDCFGRGWASALLDEMKWLHEQGHFFPNKTQFTSGSRVFQYAKPNIFEVDLHNEQLRAKVPELDALFHSNQEFLQIIGKKLPDLDLQFTSSDKTLKLQRNAGNGGCFPCHYDNPGKPNKRRLTCLLYLNDGWQPGDGGEVQLYPFLKPKVTVAPKMDRVVLFMSDWMLHRVLPSHKERFCLTIWLDGQNVNLDEHAQLKVTQSDLSDWFNFMERLRKSPVQRLLSRGVYEEEYYESLAECMNGAEEGFSAMLEAHESHLAKMKQNAGLWQFIERLKQARDMAAGEDVYLK